MNKSLLYIIVISALLSSCIYSENAYIPLDKAIEDSSFEGRYAEYKDGSDTIIEIFNVSLKSEKVYLIQPEVDEEDVEMTALITMIGKHYYIDLSSYDDQIGQTIHLLGKIVTTSDGFLIESMNVDYLTLELLHTMYNVEALEQNGSIAITSSTDILYEMLKKMDSDPEAFTNPVYYRKLK